MSESHFILVANSKGGVGKTTIADELAYSLERMGFSVAFQNLDNQGGCRHESAHHVDGEDFVVIDTPGYQNPRFSQMCSYSDLVLIPTIPSMQDWAATENTWSLASDTVGREKVGYVINRFDNRRTIDNELKSMLSGTGRNIFGIMPERTLINKAHSRRCSIAELDPYSDAVIAIDSIAEDICAYFGMEVPERSEDPDPVQDAGVDPASPFTSFLA